jgi:hypothetical protein
MRGIRLVARAGQGEEQPGRAALPASMRGKGRRGGGRKALSIALLILSVLGVNLVLATPAFAAAPTISNSDWLETKTMATNINDPLRITVVVRHDSTDTVLGLRLDEDWDGTDNTSTKGLRTPGSPGASGNCNSSNSMTISTVPGGSFNYSVIQFTCDPTYSINSCGNPADENINVRIRVETSAGGQSATSTKQVNFLRGSNDTCFFGENDMAFMKARGQTQINATPSQVVSIQGQGDDPDGAAVWDDSLDGLRWRLRNLVDGSTTGTTQVTSGVGDNSVWSFNVTAPSTRGWYVVEAELRTEGDYEYSPSGNGFIWLGTITVNDGIGGNPSVTLSSSDVDLTVPTGQALTISAAVADSNGKVQLIDWDLNDNTTDGPVSDGFELRNFISTEPSGTLVSSDLNKVINTLVPPSGPGQTHTFRARVRDNGAISGADSRAQTSAIDSLDITFKNNTTTAVSCVPTPIATSTTSTCTITVTDIASGAGTELWKPVGTGVVNVTTSSGSVTPTACNLPGVAVLGTASNSCSVVLTAAATTGTPLISASFAGDFRHMPSSGSDTVEVRNPTTTGVVCTPNPVQTTANSTCTATVTDTTTPTGTVAFTISGVNPGTFTPSTCNLTTVNATTASCTSNYSSPTPTISAFSITGTYSGANLTHMPSSGSTNIQPKNPSTTSVACVPNPVALSSTSTCTITVTDTSSGLGTEDWKPVQTVNVTTSAGGLNFSACTLPGVAALGIATNSCSVILTAPGITGPVTVSASYPGDNRHLASTGDTAATVDVRNASATSIACSPNPIGQEGATAVCTATVTDTITPTGTVSFPALVNATIDPSCALVTVNATTAACSVNFTSVTRANYTVTGNYSGAAGIMPSSGSTTMTVAFTSTITVTCVPSLMMQSATSTCTIQVQGGLNPPTGNILTTTDGGSTVDAGCTLVATGAVKSACTVTFTSPNVGVHTINASYAGDGTNDPAAHGARTGSGTVTVDPPHATTTTVSCPTPATVNVNITCTATVVDNAGNPVTPTGTITFSDSNPTGDTFTPAAGTCTLGVAGTCTVLFKSTSLGTHPLTATYGGDATLHSGSTSTAFNVVVQNRTTSSAVVCSPVITSAGVNTTCTITVTDTAVGGFPSSPRGLVTFNATGPGTGTFTPAAGTCSLTGTQPTATCSVQFKGTVPTGTTALYDIAATYVPNGVSAHLGSTAPAFQVTVAVTPAAVNDAYSTVESTTLNVVAPGVLTNDTGASKVITANTPVSHGAVTVNADGSFSYVPTGGYRGPDSFTYTFTDLAGLTRTATVNLTVTNAPPVAVHDTFPANANTATVLSVLTNDTDPSLADTLSVTGVTVPGSGGTAVISGGGTTVTYTPPFNFTGYDSFTYTIGDGNGGSASATVDVYVSTTSLVPSDKNLTFGIGGTTVANPAGYDQLALSTPYRLQNQQLVIKLRNGFLPAAGDQFDIITAPSVDGAFASVYGQVLPNGMVLDVRYLPDRVRLVAMPGLFVDDLTDLSDDNPGDGICHAANNHCTLRAAVREANAHTGADAVALRPSGTFVLATPGVDEDNGATGDLDLTGTTAVLGQSATVNGGALDRVFHVVGATVTMTKLTLTNGNVNGSAVAGAGALFNQGGDLNGADLVLSNSTGNLGGGLGTVGGSTVLNRGQLIGNTASAGGGAVAFGTVVLDGALVTGNSATSLGGGLAAGSGGSLTVKNATVSGNTAPIGGGLGSVSPSTVNITKSTFSTNTATQGGGVATSGTVNFTDTRITANTAVSGAGGYNFGTFNVLRTTFDANTATGNGGALGNEGTLTVTTSTLSGNTAVLGSGLYERSGSAALVSTTVTSNSGTTTLDTLGTSASLRNSIVADQLSGTACGVAVTSLGYNLAGDATCSLAGIGDVQNATAQLGALTNNGGWSPTHLPGAASLAVNSGLPAPACTGTDQRFWNRPNGSACEKGSVER